jgi:hypothetical protein
MTITAIAITKKVEVGIQVNGQRLMVAREDCWWRRISSSLSYWRETSQSPEPFLLWTD